MLVEAKNACYSEQVNDCRGDTKGLYRMVNTLIGTSSNNPLPILANNKDLAEEFAGFLWTKYRRSEITLPRIQYTNLQERAYLLNLDHSLKWKLRRSSLV